MKLDKVEGIQGKELLQVRRQYAKILRVNAVRLSVDATVVNTERPGFAPVHITTVC